MSTSYPIKALLINPLLQGKVYIEELTLNSWQDIAPAIDCRLFTGAGYIQSDKGLHSVFCDDEGLLTDSPQPALWCSWYSDEQPLIGKLLVTGFNSDTGASTDCKLTPDDVKPLINKMAVIMPQG